MSIPFRFLGLSLSCKERNELSPYDPSTPKRSETDETGGNNLKRDLLGQ